MPVQWFRGGPEFEAAQITSGRELAGLQGIGAGVGGGVRALQRAVQREKTLKQQEAEMNAQLEGADMAPEAPETGATGTPGVVPGGEGLPAPAEVPEMPVEAGMGPPPAAQAEPPGFLSRIGSGLAGVGRMAVGLPMEQGLTERVGALRGQLAAEQAANKERIQRMQALSRVGAANPEMLGAIHRAMPDQFPEFPAAASGEEGFRTMAGGASNLAQSWATERRGPGATPTADEIEAALRVTRERPPPPPLQPSHRVESQDVDPDTGFTLGPKVTAVYPGSPPPMAGQGDESMTEANKKLLQAMQAVPTTSTGIPLWNTE